MKNITPPFTRENAREMALRSWAIRRQRKADAEAVRLARELLPNAKDDEARRVRTLKQIDLLDDMIDAALAKKDAERFLALAATKDKLWKLVQPTAGTLKPRHAKPTPARPFFVEPLGPAPAGG